MINLKFTSFKFYRFAMSQFQPDSVILFPITISRISGFSSMWSRTTVPDHHFTSPGIRAVNRFPEWNDVKFLSIPLFMSNHEAKFFWRKEKVFSVVSWAVSGMQDIHHWAGSWILKKSNDIIRCVWEACLTKTSSYKK